MSVIEPSQAQQDLLRSRMESLRGRFQARIAEDLDAMTAALARLDHEMLRDRSHRLMGVAATFGYPKIGEAARVLEQSIDRDAPEGEIGSAARRLFALLKFAQSGAQ